MITVPAWILVIGGIITTDGFPPSMSNEMFADKESCQSVAQEMRIDSMYRRDKMWTPKISCIKVNISVVK